MFTTRIPQRQLAQLEEWDKQTKAQLLETEYKLKMQAYDEAKEKVKSLSDRELLEEIYVMLKTRFGIF